MTALEPDQRRERVLVHLDQRASGFGWCATDTFGTNRPQAMELLVD